MLNYKQVFSIVLSVIVYTYLVNFNFGLAFVVAIGFHEYGHLWAAKKCGCSTGGLYIWPFIGGTAFITSGYDSYYHKVIISFMGPFWGAALALVTALVGQQIHSPLLLSVALWMGVLNAFNLLPLGILDGGQVLESFAYSINKKLGIVVIVLSSIVGFFFLLKFNTIIAFAFVIFGYNDLISKVKEWNDPYLRYRRLSLKEAFYSVLFFIAIVIVLYITFYISLYDMPFKQTYNVLFGV